MLAISSLKCYRNFGERYWLHLQGLITLKWQEILKVEAILSPEMSVVIYGFGDFQTARHHKKALAAELRGRTKGLDKKLPRVMLKGRDYVRVFLQFPVII